MLCPRNATFAVDEIIGVVSERMSVLPDQARIDRISFAANQPLARSRQSFDVGDVPDAAQFILPPDRQGPPTTSAPIRAAETASGGREHSDIRLSAGRRCNPTR